MFSVAAHARIKITTPVRTKALPLLLKPHLMVVYILDMKDDQRIIGLTNIAVKATCYVSV